MAGGSNLTINLRTRGGDRARQDIASLANAVDRQAERVNKRQENREKTGTEKFRESFSNGALGQVSAVAIGSALGQAIPQSISALNRGVAQAFDPNLSPVEKQLNAVKAGLDVVPLELGAIPKAALEAQTQEIVGAARGTGARINQLLGPAFQGAAGLSDDEFQERFTPQIQRLREQIEPQERSRERGSQLIAENLTSFLDDFTKLAETNPEVANAQKQATEANTQSNTELRQSVDDLKDVLLATLGGGVISGGATLAGKVN